LGNLFDFTTNLNPRPKAAIKLHERVLTAVSAANGAAASKAMQLLLNDTDELIAKPGRKSRG
jgi:DNA-binding FadR family transcriptional regulator